MESESNILEVSSGVGSSGSSNAPQPDKPQNFKAGKLRGGKRRCFYDCGLYIKEVEMTEHCMHSCPRRDEVDLFEAEFRTLFNRRHPNGIPSEEKYQQKQENLAALKAEHMIRRAKFTAHWIKK